MLDAMQQLMTGGADYFDPTFLNRLRDCWDATDPDLREASNKAWQGLIDYFDNDGYEQGSWGSVRGPWVEYNPRNQGSDSIALKKGPKKGPKRDRKSI